MVKLQQSTPLFTEQSVSTWPDIARTSRLANVPELLCSPEVGLVSFQRVLDLPLQLAVRRFQQGGVDVHFRYKQPGDLEYISSLLPGPVFEDLAMLIGTIQQRFDTGELEFSLAVVQGDECLKFHRDYYALRVLCTYVGPGTLFASGRCVNEAALHEKYLCPDTANACIIPTRTSIMQATAGAVLFMKGLRWPGAQHTLPVHKSPAISAIGHQRLVLKVTVPSIGEPNPSSPVHSEETNP